MTSKKCPLRTGLIGIFAVELLGGGAWFWTLGAGDTKGYSYY
jgi:hypothetical protein